MKTNFQMLMPIIIGILLLQGTAIAQVVSTPKKAYPGMEQEQIGDPYKPNAYNNQKTSPAYRYSGYSHGKTTITSIVTVQVNVDSSGMNIIDDAANEPNIAYDQFKPESIVIGWRQFDNVESNFRQAGWSYTSDGGSTWTFPGSINPGVFRSDPVLDFDLQGNFYYNSLSVTPDLVCRVYESNDGAVSWNSGTHAGGGDKQWMAVDRTGGVGTNNIYAFWSQFSSSCLPGNFIRSTDLNDSYEDCTVVDDDPYYGTMAINNSGDLYIVGGGDNSQHVKVYKSETAKIPGATVTWNPSVDVFMDGDISGWGSINPDGLSGQANIDVDRSGGPGEGNVYVLASVWRSDIGDEADVMFSRSTDGGATWSDPLRINDDEGTSNIQWFGTMSVAPNGRIDAIWLDTRDAPAGTDHSALYYSYSTDQGITWTVNEKLSDTFDPHVGYPNQNKMGDYFDMISDETGAHLAWTNTLNGEEDVYYSHIIPEAPLTDINENFGPFASLIISPNPAHNNCQISGLKNPTTIKLLNIQGQHLRTLQTNESAVSIDISKIPAGIYWLQFSDVFGNKMVKRLIKN